jgi:large subunit ribosomal protein L22
VSAQKARLVAALVRGDDVDQALEKLAFTKKKTAPLLKKLIESAVANAEQSAKVQNQSVDIDSLFVSEVFVNQGASLRRYRPRAMGRATRIQKQTSHITVVLDSRED